MAQTLKSPLDVLKYEAKRFCQNTGLHGYRFIVLPKRTLLERIFWFVVVAVSSVTVVALLCWSWVDFQDNSTVLVTDSTHHAIWNYDFPAVTVCSFNKISKRAAFALAEELQASSGMSKEELAHQLRLLYQVISNNNKNVPLKNSTRLEAILDGYSVDELMRRLAPQCEDVLKRCKWKGEQKRCGSLFESVKTYVGYCCAFNYNALKNRTGHSPEPPKRVSACGYLTALEVLLDSQPADYFASEIPAVGHRVYIHHSLEYPDWNTLDVLTEQDSINFISVTPTRTYSGSSILQLEVGRRGCLFRDESTLHNYVYNFHNCMVECRMNISKRVCGCIPFYYNQDGGSYTSGRACGLRDIQCLSDNRDLISSSSPGYDFDTVKAGHVWGQETSECRCIPDCDYTSYNIETSSGVFNRRYSFNQQDFFGGVNVSNHSVVRVYFNDVLASKNRRDVIYSWHTILAYYGGLLGLFVGFSFICVLEVLYFFTVRLVVDSVQKDTEVRRKNGNSVVHVRPQLGEFYKKNLIVPETFNVRRRSSSNSDKL